MRTAPPFVAEGSSGAGKVFLVRVEDGSTGPYETVLRESGYTVVSWGSHDEALQHVREHSPDVLVLEEEHLDGVGQALSAPAVAGALPPDVLFLHRVENDLSSPWLNHTNFLWSAPLLFLPAERADSGSTGLSCQQIPHPADPEEFVRAVARALESRRLRQGHFLRQGGRQLYSNCSSLTWVESAGALRRQMLRIAVDVTGAVAGAVVSWGSAMVPEVDAVHVVESHWVERVVEASQKLRPRDLEWRFHPVPRFQSRGNRRRVAGQWLSVPLLVRPDGGTMLALFTGARSSLPADMAEDLQLVVEHCRLGLSYVGNSVPEENRFRDPWTGLSNREGVLRAADRAIAADRGSVGMVVMDIDGFGRVNERFGHLVGGAIVRMCARTCLAHLKRGQWMGRIGPDEFAIVMPGCNGEETFLWAERFVEAVGSTPCVLENVEEPVPVTMTAGAASTGSGRWDGRRLLEHALAALSEGKKNGGNQACSAQGDGGAG